MTLAQLIAQLRASMAARLAERDQHRAVIAEVRSACFDNGTERQPSTDEASRIQAAEAAVRAIDADTAVTQSRIETLERELAADEAAGRLSREVAPTVTAPIDVDPETGVARRSAPYDRTIKVGDTTEERTYTERKMRRGEARFLSDAFNAQRGNPQARERIERHGNEVLVHNEISERALSTGGIAGLTPPQYLTDLAAPVLRAGQPVANSVNRHQLPETGMALIIPRGTTGASATAQATENTAVGSTDQVWSNLTVPVCTVAGQQQVSRQALERGEGMEDIIFLDLARAHAAQKDNYLINGSGAAGQPLGMLNTAGIAAATAFGAAPGPANQQLKIAGGITAVTSAGAGIWPKVIYMHPRRWGWMTGLVDTTNRPIVTASQVGMMNALAAINDPGKYGGDDDPISGLTVVGFHSSGLPIITDLNIPTAVGTNAEDIEIVADPAELHLWQDGDGMPTQLTFEQTAGNSLTTTLVVYSYIAFTAGRYPQCVAKIGGLDTTAGNGLVAPSF